jgi:endoglucanase
MPSSTRLAWTAGSCLLLLPALAGCFKVTNGNQTGSGGSTVGPGGGSGGGSASGSGGAGGAVPSLPMLRRAGRDIVGPDGAPVLLRGVSFGNDVWSGRAAPPTKHHAEADFQRLRDWGMNAIRFYLNYQLFEDDGAPYQYKPSGWAWLDQNIDWGRRHGVYLILNMHLPQGGFQSNGAGAALWQVAENRARLQALWRAIAERYRSEGTIAGFDLLNEPRPPTSRQQWIDLAAAMTAAIRQVDGDHLVFVERTNSVGEDWSNDGDMNFFLVPDANVVYEFHDYDPFEYTPQLTSWTGLPEGGKYPDDTALAGLTWYDWSWQPAPPPQIPAGDSAWARYESQPYALTDPAIKAIGITLLSELNSGTAFFDDVFINEYDPAGALVGPVYQQNIEALDGWTFWKAGAAGSVALSADAHSGVRSLTITGTDHDASAAAGFRYLPKPGHRYSAGGWIKGAAVSSLSRPDPRGNWTQSSRALVRLDYYTGSGAAAQRNKAMLEASVGRFVAWGAARGVPVYLGEFGVYRACFEGGRGGVAWVSDMLDIAAANRLPFTYHAYHEPAFGVFTSDATVALPDPAAANTPLIDLFRAKLAR